jgi:hypothetical protein
MWKTSV